MKKSKKRTLYEKAYMKCLSKCNKSPECMKKCSKTLIRRSIKGSIKRGKRASVRRSIKRGKRASIRRSIKRGKQDGGKEDKIILEKYIENIMLYSKKPFLYTLTYFRHLKQNTTTDFIKQLFIFDKNNNNDVIYPQKYTILGLIILLGLYEKFESFIENIKLIPPLPPSDSAFTDCDKRSKLEFDRAKGAQKQYQKLNIDEKSKHFFENNIKEDFFNEKIRNYETIIEKKVVKSENIINLISKFLFYSVCTIKPKTRQYIMRHYLLCFIGLDIYKNLKLSENLITSSSSELKQKKINGFLMIQGSFRKLPYIELDFTTCGETTILNLLNYFLIDKRGNFVIKDYFTDPVKTFYTKNDNIKKQLDNIKETTRDWLKIVSNLENKTIYTPKGDIHNNKNNILYVFRTILNLEEDSIEDILKSINGEYNLELIDENENSVEFLLDDKFKVSFKPGHGDMIFEEDEKIKIKITADYEDYFVFLYNNFSNFISLHREDYLLCINDMIKKNILREDESDIVDDFLSIQTTHDVYDEYDFYSLNKLKNLKKLKFTNNDGLLKIPKLNELKELTHLFIIGNRRLENISKETFDGLNKLNHLKIIRNEELELTEDAFDTLVNLQSLEIIDNQMIKLPKLNNLKNLKVLDISGNELITEEIQFDFPNLKRLDINGFFGTKLGSFDKLTNLEGLSINQSDSLQELPSFDELKNLKSLEISEIKELKAYPKFDKLTQLNRLRLIYNENVKELVVNFPNLEILDILDSDKNLNNLSITNLAKIEKISIDKAIGVGDRKQMSLLFFNDFSKQKYII